VHYNLETIDMFGPVVIIADVRTLGPLISTNICYYWYWTI